MIETNFYNNMTMGKQESKAEAHSYAHSNMINSTYWYHDSGQQEIICIHTHKCSKHYIAHHTQMNGLLQKTHGLMFLTNFILSN